MRVDGARIGTKWPGSGMKQTEDTVKDLGDSRYCMNMLLTKLSFAAGFLKSTVGAANLLPADP